LCTQVEKRKPTLAYGKAQMLDGEIGQWSTSIKSKDTGDKWATLFDTFVTFNGPSLENPLNKPVVMFRAAGHVTCAEFTRRAYGIPEGTWLQGIVDAKRKPGGAVLSRELLHAKESRAGVDEAVVVTSSSEAVEWWADLITCIRG
jgi:hypothetical protein